jgi:hypothetical protein
MYTASQIIKLGLLKTKTGKVWDAPRIGRTAKKLGAKYIKNKYGWALGITDDMIEKMKDPN